MVWCRVSPTHGLEFSKSFSVEQSGTAALVPAMGRARGDCEAANVLTSEVLFCQKFALRSDDLAGRLYPRQVKIPLE